MSVCVYTNLMSEPSRTKVRQNITRAFDQGNIYLDTCAIIKFENLDSVRESFLPFTVCDFLLVLTDTDTDRRNLGSGEARAVICLSLILPPFHLH